MKKITFFILLLTLPFFVFSQTVSLTVESGARITVESGASLTLSSNAILTNNGTITVVDGGTLTLKSDINGSAFIGEGTGSFTGDFTIERYIPARRAFRLLSSPVTTDDFIGNNWQKGTHITGVAGTVDPTPDPTTGFDFTTSGNPSMFTYNNIDQTWSAIPNTNALNLINGTPYRIMVRGDRDTDLSTNLPELSDVTLSATGTLDEENVVSPTVIDLNETASGFSLVGNPFQAPIDMSLVLINTSTLNVNTAFYYIWDPVIGGLHGRGGWVTYTFGVGATAGSATNQYLQAGQAGFVKTIADGQPQTTISFEQANKFTDGPETKTFKTVSGKSSMSKLILNLYESNSLAENESAQDGLILLFDESFSNDVNYSDASKFTNLDENFATSNNGELLSVERRTTPIISDEIPLNITKYRHTNYTIVAEGNSLNGETTFLYDSYINEYTEIPQDGTVNYAYSINTNIPASTASDRFTVKFSAKSLPVSTLEIEKIHLYPNPVSDGALYLNVPKEMDDLELTIYNVLGAKLFSKTGFKSGSRATINTSFANGNGLYFIELSSNGQTITKKIIID